MKLNKAKKDVERKPLCFFEKTKVEIIKRSVTEKGIACYCCDEMEKACKPFEFKKKNISLSKKNIITADSNIWNEKNNKIGIKTHVYEDDSSYDYYSTPVFLNFVVFNFCPFCGTKINGYVIK
jgi:hypothetical protein